MESIERTQADPMPNIPLEYELPLLDVSQNIDIRMLTDDSLLRGQVEPHATSDDLYDENSCESRKSTVLSTGSNTLRDRDETVAMNPESSAPSDDVHSWESLQQNSYGVHSHGKVCALCGGTHFIGLCEEFKSLTIDDRWNRARQLKLCFRCLKATTGGLWSLSPPSSQTLCHWSNSITNLW